MFGEDFAPLEELKNEVIKFIHSIEPNGRDCRVRKTIVVRELMKKANTVISTQFYAVSKTNTFHVSTFRLSKSRIF